MSLQQWISHPELLNKDTLYELRNWVARYPYFQTLHLLYLKNLYLLHDAEYGVELRKSLPYIADRRILFYLIEENNYALDKVASSPTPFSIEEEPEVDRTLSLIDAFLATVPEEQRQVSSELDYTLDYTTYLLEGEEQDKESEEKDNSSYLLRGHNLIDEFIQQAASDDLNLALPKAESHYEAENSMEVQQNTIDEEVKEEFFTETLAKIYVKQQRYEKALEIIKRLSLNYPKKNAYFADQIRFLEKLIINAKLK